MLLAVINPANRKHACKPEVKRTPACVSGLWKDFAINCEDDYSFTYTFDVAVNYKEKAEAFSPLLKRFAKCAVKGNFSEMNKPDDCLTCFWVVLPAREEYKQAQIRESIKTNFIIFSLLSLPCETSIQNEVPVNCFVQEERFCLFKGKQKQELASTENDVIS